MKTFISILGILSLTIISTAFSIKSEKAENQVLSHQQVPLKREPLLKIAQANSFTSGKKLYETHCSRCHGEDRKGISPTYPSLLNLNEKLTKTEAKEIIKEGKGNMPSF